jgi:hypothetical protein
LEPRIRGKGRKHNSEISQRKSFNKKKTSQNLSFFFSSSNLINTPTLTQIRNLKHTHKLKKTKKEERKKEKNIVPNFPF